jgi:AcrR family transcriptional regulator
VPRAKQRTPELRAQILRAAVALLTREGAAGLTTRRVAEAAETSAPAVYELFGDKAGLVRELLFEGFRMLRARLDAVAQTADPRADLEHTIRVFSAFIREHETFAELMFLRRLADFDPGPADVEAGAAVRELLIARVRRCIAAGVLAGDATDIAHALVSTAQGLASTELAGWLGSSRASIERRWTLAIRALLDGLGPQRSQ